jgi:hypothetical protein
MKKIVLFMVAALTAFGANAQGTWKATGSETRIGPTTAIETGITGLTVMHNDAADAGVIGKSDGGAKVITYNSITWDNEAHIQGVNNGMFYALSPEKDGTIDVSVKMGNGKNTLVAETNDAILTVAAQTITGSDKTPQNKVTDPVFLSVYDTYNNSTGTWNNTAPINPSSEAQYLVMSFTVTAGKTYIVGCDGSKLMLRGLHYSTTSLPDGIPTLATDKAVKSVEYYDLTGRKVTNENQKNALLIKKTTYVDGTTSSNKVITKVY